MRTEYQSEEQRSGGRKKGYWNEKENDRKGKVTMDTERERATKSTTHSPGKQGSISILNSHF